jgi:hypothetical protein
MEEDAADPAGQYFPLLSSDAWLSYDVPRCAGDSRWKAFYPGQIIGGAPLWLSLKGARFLLQERRFYNLVGVSPSQGCPHLAITRPHQLSVYLEPPVYDALRDLAHEERTKLHPLILEAIDLLLKKRGAPSIRELTRKAGAIAESW